MIANLRIGTRLGIAFAILVLLLTGVAVLSVTKANAINDELNVIVKDRFPKVVKANVISTSSMPTPAWCATCCC